MTNIFFIGCTHFNHENILNFTKSDGTKLRDFDDINEMNERIIEMWNKTVSKNDVVYHLGDVCYSRKNISNAQALSENFRLIRRLNGNRRLILGNHDNKLMKYYADSGLNVFHRCYVDLPLPNFGIFLSHRPAHQSQMFDYETNKELINVHAHIHYNDSPSSQHRNVCVEKVNYTPISIEEIK